MIHITSILMKPFSEILVWKHLHSVFPLIYSAFFLSFVNCLQLRSETVMKNVVCVSAKTSGCPLKLQRYIERAVELYVYMISIQISCRYYSSDTRADRFLVHNENTLIQTGNFLFVYTKLHMLNNVPWL